MGPIAVDKIRILVVDDHSIVRQGIRSLLSNYPEFEIVAEADNGATAIDYAQQFTPDVTLLDIRMPDRSGLEVLRQIRQRQPGAKVLILTSFEDDEYVMGALRAGAYGFVSKSGSDTMLVSSIRAVHRGEHVLSPQVTGTVVQRVIATEDNHASKPLDFDKDEQQILRLLVDGASNAEIAAKLFLSNTTVKRKLRNIFTKLNVHTRAQAAAEAIRQNLLN